MEGMLIRSAPKPAPTSSEANRLRGEMMVLGEGSLVQSTGSTGRCSRVVDDGFFSLRKSGQESCHVSSAFSVAGTLLGVLMHYLSECSQ